MPGVREGLVGQALPVIDVCGVRIHQHPSHLVLGSVHGLQEEAGRRCSGEGEEAAHLLFWLGNPGQIYLPTSRKMLNQVIYRSSAWT